MERELSKLAMFIFNLVAVNFFRIVLNCSKNTLHFSYVLCILLNLDSPIAQSVERRTVNPQVAGSSPARGAKDSERGSEKSLPLSFCAPPSQSASGTMKRPLPPRRFPLAFVSFISTTRYASPAARRPSFSIRSNIG